MPIPEYHPRDFEPRYLSKEQIEDPLLVLDEFFDYGNLPEIREKLWEWVRLTVTGSFHKEDSMEKVNIMHFYEQICKLVEAAHILFRKKEGEEFEG